jgi:hypothetical protein
MFVIYSRFISQGVFRVHSVYIDSRLLFLGSVLSSFSWFHYVYPFVCIVNDIICQSGK